MGRWAQAARRGGGRDRPAEFLLTAPAFNNVAGKVQITWTAAADPRDWTFEIDVWSVDHYVPASYGTVPGGSRQFTTTLDYSGFNYRARVRGWVWTRWVGWTDYTYLSV